MPTTRAATPAGGHPAAKPALGLLLAVLIQTAAGANVTIAFTSSVRGRLFQFGQYGGDCKQELYSCCDLVPGCKGGMSRMSAAVKALRGNRPPGSVILLDGGQQVGDTSAWQTFRGSMMRNVMLQMNYTAKGIASNELYMGPNNLAEFASGQDQFSLLGANLKVDPRHQLEQLIAPQMVVSAGGVVVGITAVSAENICTTSNCLVNRVPMLSAVPVEAALTGAIGFMLNRGSTLVVVIASGFGFIDAKSLAQRVPRVDVIICASDEWGAALDEMPYVETGPTGQPVIILTNIQLSETFGYVDLELDTLTQQLVGWEATRVMLDEDAPFDEEMSVLLRAAEELASVEREIGWAIAPFGCPDNELAAVADGGGKCHRFGESAVGNLIADAMLEASRGRGATITLFNSGGIRSDTLPAGPITDKDARGLLPFANTVSVLHITGKTLQEALNHGTSALNATSGTGRYLQLAGIRMRFDMDRPEDDRVLEVYTLLSNGSWAPLHQDDIYVVATVNFMRDGGDGYSMLANDHLLASDQGPAISSTLISYLEARYPDPGVRPALLGRAVNASAGALELAYSCHENLVVTDRQGILRDECAPRRAHTQLRWEIQPEAEAQQLVALRLTISLDPRWLAPPEQPTQPTQFEQPALNQQAAPAEQPAPPPSPGNPSGTRRLLQAAVSDYITVARLQDSDQGDRDLAGNSGLSVLELASLVETADGMLRTTVVVSAAAAVVVVESERDMTGWHPLEVEYEALDECPGGYSAEQSGLQEECGACPRGSFSQSGGECLPCPSGTANNRVAQAECLPCAAGEYQPFGGQLECESCPGSDEQGATSCPVATRFPVWAIALLAAGLACLVACLAAFLLQRLRQARAVMLSHFTIDFKELDFGEQPTVLGTGELGITLAAKYRTAPVVVKQISGFGGRDVQRSHRASSILSSDRASVTSAARIQMESSRELTELIGQDARTVVATNRLMGRRVSATALEYMSGSNPRPLMHGMPRRSDGAGEAWPPPKPDSAGPGPTPAGGPLKTAPTARTSSDAIVAISPSGSGDAEATARASTESPTPWALPGQRRPRRVAPQEAGKSAPPAQVGKLFTLRHPHLVTLLGLTTGQDGSRFLVMEDMERGCLSDVLANRIVPLDAGVKLSISRDVAAGMGYMHACNPPLLHRMLRAANVKLDGKFTAKVGDFGLGYLLGAGVTQQGVNPLWMAPEVLRGDAATRESDVYAFGILLFETWTRQEPYEGESMEDVVRDVARPPAGALRIIWKRPILPEEAAVPATIAQLMEACWHQDPQQRPTFQEVADTLELARREVADVAAREAQAAALRGHQDRELLERILPPHIAALLKEGKEVPPEQHELVTVLFTDIVGFTDISSTLMPEQVMDMLNRLYHEFDALTDKYDLFKVETIGDAYMAVANLHKLQPDHTQRMCCFALEAIKAAQRVEVLPGSENSERPWGTLRIRAGIHCGPVVASVVGKLNPRYCLFGDTVNTAARMESNSVALRVHLSSFAAARLKKQAPGAVLEKRGTVEIKGKGKMTTHFLLECPEPIERSETEQMQASSPFFSLAVSGDSPEQLENTTPPPPV